MATVTIAGCSNSDHKTTVNKPISKDAPSSVGTSFLDDKNYPYKNVSNTLAVKIIDKKNSADNMDGKVYTDSTYKTTFIQLSKEQKIQLIGPFIKKELGVNEQYAADLMTAYFVSKQKKIGDLQPILIQIEGDDYGSLTMIILDKNHKPIDGYNVDGGPQGGPTELGDSLIKYEVRRYSHIKGTDITTYDITETDHTDTTKKQETIDSEVFKTIIGTSGTFSTRRIVKTSFVKLSTHK